MNLKEKLISLQDSKGNYNGNKLKKTGLNEIIKTETKFLDDYNPSNRERIHCIINDITEVLFCKSTGKKLKYSPYKKKYCFSREYSGKMIKNRTKKFNYKERNDNIWNDILKNFNTNNYNLIDKDRCIEVYKSMTEGKKNVISITRAALYMDLVCSIFKHTEFMKVERLNLSERCYCIEHGILEIQLDYKGVPLKFRDRTTGYSVYGEKRTMYLHKIENAKTVLNTNYTVNKFIHDPKDKGNLISRVSLTCKTCDYSFISLFKNCLWKKVECPKCGGFVNRSKMEVDFVKMLRTNGFNNIIENDRQILDGYELDIYLPDKKIAIELCGLTWHSFGYNFPNNAIFEKQHKNKHLEKYKKCEELGIKLITIFENEWKLKKDLVISIILNKLGATKNKIYARNCEFRDVDYKESNNFLNINHIQGGCSHSKSYGLYYEDELVSLMCFGKRKLTRGECEYELIRFCNKMNTSVVGGASKILKRSNIDRFISYCDLRFSEGNLYRTLGMELIRITKPNYYYTKNMKIHHRMKFQKHKISESGDTRTEREIMYENGYRRIYDCGNLVFEYQNTK